jgi:hypothetical protein
MYDSGDLLPGAIRGLLLLAVWCVWWLLCVDWKKLWPVLAFGAWAPAVLFVLMTGAVWARLDDRNLTWPGFYLPSFGWHVGATILLAGLALICGWLQGVIGWMPPEFPVHPPELAHGHAPADGHGHH